MLQSIISWIWLWMILDYNYLILWYKTCSPLQDREKCFILFLRCRLSMEGIYGSYSKSSLAAITFKTDSSILWSHFHGCYSGTRTAFDYVRSDRNHNFVLSQDKTKLWFQSDRTESNAVLGLLKKWPGTDFMPCHFINQWWGVWWSYWTLLRYSNGCLNQVWASYSER